jgi:hypothetical protein
MSEQQIDIAIGACMPLIILLIIVGGGALCSLLPT